MGAMRSSTKVTVIILSAVLVGLTALGYFVYRVFEPAFSQMASGFASGDSAEATNGPGAVDKMLIDHIQAERYEEAYALMARGYRETVPLDEFRRAVSGNAYLLTRQHIGCYHMVTYEDRVHIRNCVLESEVGMASATLYYALEEKEWRMTGITIGGVPAMPFIVPGKDEKP